MESDRISSLIELEAEEANSMQQSSPPTDQAETLSSTSDQPEPFNLTSMEQYQYPIQHQWDVPLTVDPSIKKLLDEAFSKGYDHGIQAQLLSCQRGLCALIDTVPAVQGSHGSPSIEEGHEQEVPASPIMF